MDFSEDILPIFISLFQILQSVICWPFPKAKKDLNGEVVVITGAGSGIGALLAAKLAKMGCVVVAWDINEEVLQSVIQQIKNAGGKAFGFKCDVSDREQVYFTAKESAKVAGDVTMLINNAGIVGGKNLLETDDEMVKKTFEVNAISHFWTTKAFLPKMMEKNHGHIVSIASSLGYFAAPKLTDYCSSKAAAAHFADALSVELYKAKSSVNVTWVCPYTISTGMFKGVFAGRPWMCNVFKPEFVADQIIQAIQENRNKVFLPKLLDILSLLKEVLPREAMMTFLSWFGVLDAMNDFIGRKKQA
ncbi:unnamed protein product [Oikopleura dioica]|uniref:Short-chain dehydrogenase/reductase 3 n=1 Tax=Oikopleura dioica TaxID=34765 RepID=E4XT76_OIKDI|nr:unnamed protein product [Oikopleura dioica]